jgi:hypothetical protein
VSNLALFSLGALVTLVVVTALAVLVWGATLDGRYQREHEAEAPLLELLPTNHELHVVDAA